MSMQETNTAPLTDQVGRLVARNRFLQVKSDSDDHVIRTLNDQYAKLAGEVDGIRDDAARKETALRIERDLAIAKYEMINGLLVQAGDLLMQAFRAREGDKTPEKTPERVLGVVTDDRLPIARLSQ